MVEGNDGATRAALRSLRAFLTGPDPQPNPRTRLGQALPLLAAALAFLLSLAAFAYLNSHTGLPGSVLLLASALTVAPLALLPARPLLAWRVAWTAAFVSALTIRVDDHTGWPWQPVQIILLAVVLFAVGLRHPRGVLVWVWLSAAVLVVGFVTNNNAPGLLLAVTAILFVADQIRRRREAQSRLAVEQERTELEQARRAILEERTRIARELHDVVAHHMSLIAVRAETAPYRIEGVPAPVAEELAAIAETSREALTEMRRLLGVLRSATPPPVQPQPGLADLTDLVQAARDAGVDAQLTVDARLAADPVLWVPSGAGLTAYRIVQEALSNARRHAAGAPVRIALRAEDTALAVSVVNGPGVPIDTGLGRPAHGLVGMRERATMLGGSLVAGPTPDGGFAVRATLPMTGAA
jgi:signal transduction histidine kinase